jgi:imidazolonepropionase-like amidohydrolase
MTPEEIAAIVDEAHRRNILVTSHAQSTQGVKEALQAGVDNIEHGAALDRETIALFLNNPKSKRGYSTLHPTLSMGAGMPELTDEVRENPAVYVIYQNGKLISAGSANGYRSAIENGVKVGLGTDAGLVDHAAAWKELTYFVQHAEVSNREALYMGTLGTAESIGVESVTGSIEPGKSADFIALERDPIEDLSALAAPYLVVAQGIRIER